MTLVIIAALVIPAIIGLVIMVVFDAPDSRFLGWIVPILGGPLLWLIIGAMLLKDAHEFNGGLFLWIIEYFYNKKKNAHASRVVELITEVTQLKSRIASLTTEIAQAKIEQETLFLQHAEVVIPPPKITSRKVRVC